MKALAIGQLAKQAHVNIETIRYHERRGLIPEPPRRESGYCQYAPDTVRRIKFIKRAQELGFSLKEIQELLTLRVDPGTTSADIKRQTEAKLADIETKLRKEVVALPGMRRLPRGGDPPARGTACGRAHRGR